MMQGWGDGWWLMWIWMAAFWLLFFAGIVWFVARPQHPRSGATPAAEVLNQRLARGEIGVEQYRTLREEIGAGEATESRTAGNGPVLLAIVAAIAFVVLVGATAIAAARDDLDMFDHMGRMGRGRDTANSPLTVGDETTTVTIEDFAYSPGNLEVPVGATVTWINRDSAPHDATSRDGSWRTETLSSDESDSISYDDAGEYDYYCSIHPSMKGHLTVRTADAQ